MSSQRYDLIVENARIVYRDLVIDGKIAVRNGKIAALLRVDELVEADQTIDAEGRYVLPGLIDSHVHFRTPGYEHKENWYSASKAAVAGGITTVLDMPNTNPYTDSVERLRQKSALVSGQSFVDYGFHIGVAPGKSSVLEALNRGEAASIKLFLTGHRTAKHIIDDDAELDYIFRLAATKSIPLTLHAEDDVVLRLFRQISDEPSNLSQYEAAYPRSGAIVAVARILRLIRKHDTSVHVLHVSSSEEADLLDAAAEAGYPVTYETTAHQLWFDHASALTQGTRAKLSPAIREPRDRTRLWESIKRGTLASVGSDHAPHSKAEKDFDFNDAPPGLPGVQELLSVLLTGLKKYVPSLTREERLLTVAKLLASGPATRFGFDHLKGSIEAGLDADFVILDDEKKWTVSEEHILSGSGWSPYEGIELEGQVLVTIVRGQVVYNRGQFGEEVGEPLVLQKEVTKSFQHTAGSPYYVLA
ncbi:dihydroorotase family protein [Paenibacillus sp. GSMTC-2017]|uniref:dihydroorotase n=1 Tax=Paenibacillus sp. GSMTC-2017 TaxID=2794350 RepID=UPI0018D92889|nr:dihydroorotase family protein [Paenibacillus sp. GSMTC-2017]MBH5318742.1 dihydroorotase family protein [Paenibacillus sp. GSMTC-2017]